MRQSKLVGTAGTAMTILGGTVWAEFWGPILVVAGLVVVICAFFMLRNEEQDKRENLSDDVFGPAVAEFLALLAERHSSKQKNLMMVDVAAADWPTDANWELLPKEQSRDLRSLAEGLWGDAAKDPQLRERIEKVRTPIKKAFREWNWILGSWQRRSRRFLKWLRDDMRPAHTPTLKLWIYVEMALPVMEGMGPARFGSYGMLIEKWSATEHKQLHTTTSSGYFS